MAVLPVAVLEGAEARGYSMMICFSALASWTLLANIRSERTWRWAVYAALVAMGVWVHFVTAFEQHLYQPLAVGDTAATAPADREAKS